MRSVQVSKSGMPFAAGQSNKPDPGRKEVLVKVAACGICHSDVFVREGLFPGIAYPRIPGHEVVGVIEKTGEDVSAWKTGDTVGVGWHGGHCFACDACRKGDFILCANARVTGISSDGGYAEYMIAREEALARVPEGMAPEYAAPLLCAGVTTFNALRHCGARAGDLVAIQGIGGLGHLGIQFASRMGFHTVALSSGKEKESLARSLGAHDYIDLNSENSVSSLSKMGGAKVILATAPSSSLASRLVDALSPNGNMVLVGVDANPLSISPLQLIGGRKRISGWPSGHAKDSEETLLFAHQAGIRSMVETYPLEQAETAYQVMMSNKARFRVVLTM
ncbi:MAG: alcohol dehydrogenase [Leptospirillum sp.]|nr:alcohol dehydrogenase [Nitrospiraceae bacterium]